MIYIIDDKQLRQERDFGWTRENLKKYGEYITPIYTLDELRDIKEDIFKSTNTVLYHESFLDNTVLDKEADFRRSKLEKFAQDNSTFNLVIFSGSKSSRTINQNIAHLPVSILYQNLDLFIKKATNNELDINYLVFGNNPNIENELLNKLEDSLLKLEDEPVKIENQTSVFLTTPERDIQNPIKEATILTLFDEESDENISKFIKENLSECKYNNIFIPLCYGNSLSDYNGLRLAVHIRCTEGLNQLTRIFIYGFVGLDYLIQNKYFNILKTKDVSLVDFSKQDFKDAATMIENPLTIEKLPKEISKLKLDPPKNYYDNHSIANEWAIHQWAKTIGCDETEELEKVFQNVQSNLYFKYLKVINPIYKQDRISSEKLKINYEGNPKVLLVDDEAEKGWEEIFAHLLYDVNNINVDYLGHDFKNYSSDKIIQQTIDKIKTDDIDVVILDFRLNQSDFESRSNEEITSIKILKKIKEEVNPGIQVIIFSATNKIWNLQALQNAGADGFIFKDGRDNINQSIIGLIDKLKSSVEKSLWLKPIWSKTKSIINHLTIQVRKKVIDKNFAGGVISFLKLSFDALDSDKNKFSFDSAFMYYFLILETISKQVIDEDNAHKITYTNKYNEVKEGYKFQFRSSYDFLKDYEGNDYMQVAIGEDLISGNKRLPYGAKFHNLISSAGILGIDPLSIVKLRNDFNHPDLIENKRTAVIKKENVESLFEVCYKLIRNL